MPALITDDFNRADSTTLGANWSPSIDSLSENKSPQVLSNQAATGSLATHDSLAAYTGAAWTGGADHYTELTPIQSLGSGLGPMARCTFGNGTNVTRGYVAYIDAVGSSSAAHQLYRVDDLVSFVALGSPFTLTIVNTDVVRIEVQGTTIRYLVNGVAKQTVTDATYATGTPGIFLGRNTAAADSIADSFAAGTFDITAALTGVSATAAAGTVAASGGDVPVTTDSGIKRRTRIRPAPFKVMGDGFRSAKNRGFR